MSACESPVTPAAVPSSLLARAAIEQFGAPGEAAFQSPLVLVWNQFGLPMKDVSVRFTASHGSLEHAEARSDSMGYASPGKWTLRSTEGEDVVTATIDGVEPLRFRSRVRVEVEVAHYALESLDGRTVPFESGGNATTAGSLSFFADDTWMWQLAVRDQDGSPFTNQMQGFYTRDGQRLAGAQASQRNPWQLDATFSGDRLTAYFTDRIDGWHEVHVKVRSAGSWP